MDDKFIVTPKEDKTVTMTIRIDRTYRKNIMNYLQKQIAPEMN